MNSIEQRQRKFQIMKERSHPQRYISNDFNERNLEQHRDLADRQHTFLQMHHLELLVQSRRHSNALEGLLEALLSKPAPKQNGGGE